MKKSQSRRKILNHTRLCLLIFFLHLKTIKEPYYLCYENIFDQGYFFTKDQKISLDLDPELPMAYGVDKKDFFNNYEMMIEMLDQIVRDNDLEDLFKDLGIFYG
jgi:hypothetical protein